MSDPKSSARPFLREVRCSVCGSIASRAQLARGQDGWRFIFSGIDSGSGPDGTVVDEDEAAKLSKAFAAPVTYARVHKAGLYDDAGFCDYCKTPYCFEHWNVSSTGGGTCPQGHFKSLDPHWHPED